MNANRLRPAVLTLAAVALTAVLTGCGEGTADTGADSAPSTGATATPSPSTTTGKPDAAPSVTASPAKAGSSATATSSAAPAADSGDSADSGDCAAEPPAPDEVDPDEIALYRIEELDGSTGKVNLVIEHGAWGCPGKDTDGAPFVGTGEKSRWALDQAAYVTATNPITDTTENQRIGVQELIDWVDAHPDSGLVFRYETGDDGAIHRLEQVFTP